MDARFHPPTGLGIGIGVRSFEFDVEVEGLLDLEQDGAFVDLTLRW